tara:strand:+ start:2245 stop:2388 length:144 start_codon:yes stop_codon:yes gene_type:complete
VSKDFDKVIREIAKEYAKKTKNQKPNISLSTKILSKKLTYNKNIWKL